MTRALATNLSVAIRAGFVLRKHTRRRRHVSLLHLACRGVAGENAPGIRQDARNDGGVDGSQSRGDRMNVDGQVGG